jgi:(p)ppGpp synthase/HD superfamily hydrolase
MHEQLQRALQFAVHAHAGQWREGPSPLPYATHPVEVASLLRDVGGVADEGLLCAAFLHDVLEATDCTRRDIEREFGADVAGLVLALTRREPTLEQAEGLSPGELWELRAAMLLEDVARMDPRAWPVKLADRLSNVRDARRTKSGRKLERYLMQTTRILAIVPPAANPALWEAVRAECPG